MTRAQFVKQRFKAYMEIDYQPPRKELPIRCMLVAVDFDEEILTLCPIDIEYNQDNFNVNMIHCFIPKLRVIKKTNNSES